MARDYVATVRNALISISSTTYTSLRLRPLETIRSFHPWRPITKLTQDHVKPHGKKTNPCPPYPYGPRHTLKEADAGLYGGAQVQSGNKISQGRNKGKTRRRWHPNVRVETIRSEALNETLTIPITASCMRTIRKCGGLDQYLLGDKPARIKELGLFGWRLRWRVMRSEAMRETFRKEREDLGLPLNHPRSSTFEKAWRTDQVLKEEVLKEHEKQWKELREKDQRFQQHVRSRWQPKDKKVYKTRHVIPSFDRPAFESIMS